MQMYYLKDNKTGKKYELSTNKILFARLIPIASFILYGMIIALILSFFDFSSQTSFMYLAVAYSIELIFWFSNKISPGKCIGAVLLIISWRHIFTQLFGSVNIKHKGATSKIIHEYVKFCKLYDRNAINYPNFQI